MRKQGLIVVFYLLASVMRGQEDSASSRFRKALYIFKFSNFIRPVVCVPACLGLEFRVEG